MAVTINKASFARSLSLLFASTSLAGAVAGNSFAQEIPIPPPYSNLDDNGVDLVSDMFSTGIPVGSIGSGDGLLSLTEYFGAVQGNSLQMGFRRVVNSGQATISITINNRSETFSGASAATSFTSNQGTGATLVKNSAQLYTLTQQDGTVTSFGWPSNLEYKGGKSGFCSTTSQATVCALLANTTTYKSGQVITREWRAGETCVPYVVNGEPLYDNCAHFFRLTSISNRHKYKIAFTYLNNTDPATLLPASTWYVKTSAVFSNLSDASATRTATYAYPSSTVTEITDHAGDLWRVTRVNGVSIASIRKPGSTADNLTITADVAGKVSQITNAGVVTNYAYSVAGSQATMIRTNALSQSTTIVSDLNVGRPAQVTDPNSKTTTYLYDTQSRLQRVTMPEQNYVHYTYDGRGNITSQRLVAKPSTGLADIVTSSAYPANCTNAALCDKPVTTTDAKGQVTNYEYDATHGGVTKITAPAPTPNATRPETRYGYTVLSSGLHALTSISACRSAASCINGADETKTSIAYNAGNSLPQSTSTGAGNGSLTATQLFAYDAIGNLLTVDSPLPGSTDTTRYRYDAARRVVGIVGPDPDGVGPSKAAATKYSYDGKGQLALVQVGTVIDSSDSAWANLSENYRVAYAYDANGRQNRHAVTAGSARYEMADVVYDALGRVSCSITYMNPAHMVSAGLPPQATACAPYQTNGPDGPDRVVKANYDALGRATSVQEGVGTAVVSTVMAATFSDNGMQKTLKDGQNNLTTYEYDGFDRLSKMRYPSATQGANASSTTDYVQLTYDANSNVTNARLRDGQNIGLTYDNINRLTFKNMPGTEADVSYAYDLQGRPLTVTGATTLTNSYDALGRLITEGQPFGSMAYEYDLTGQRTKVTWSDGLYVNYDYDHAGRMLKIRENGATSGIGVLATFTYNDLGFRTAAVFGNGTSANYTPDPISRLSAMAHNLSGTAQDINATFGMNLAGQIKNTVRSNASYAWTGHVNVSRSYASNGLNQYAAAGSATFSYDGRGNLTSDGINGYTYSSENLLKTATGSVTLNYDPMGRLNEFNAGPSTRFVYDGSHMAAEVANPSGAITRRYVYAAGADEPIVWYEGSGTGDRRWLHADERGSIIAVTNSSGASIATNRYDEYGIPASTNLGRFQYTGQAWLAGLGMYYYKARVYSPTLGRFMQADPIGYGDGMNMYAYVGNDPINFVDSLGLGKTPPPSNVVIVPTCPPGDNCGPDLTVNGQRPPSSATPSAVGGPVAGGNAGGGRGGRGESKDNDQSDDHCAPAPKFGVPKGYKPYDSRGRTMTKIGDPRRTVVMNPAYQSFVNNSRLDLMGAARDLFFIAVGSVSGGLSLVSSGTATGATVTQTVRYAGAAAAAGGAADKAQSGAEAHPGEGRCVNSGKR